MRETGDGASFTQLSDSNFVQHIPNIRTNRSSCALPGVQLCGSVTGSIGSQPVVQIDNGWDHVLVPVVDGMFSWTAPLGWLKPESSNDEWLDVTLTLHDLAGIDASTSWICNVGINGCASILMPTSSSIDLGEVTMTPGIEMSGVITKLSDGSQVPITVEDLAGLCVEAHGINGSGTNHSHPGRWMTCADPVSGFGIDPETLGKWKMVLPAGNYYLEVMSRARPKFSDGNAPKLFGGFLTASGKLSWSNEDLRTISLSGESVADVDTVMLPVGRATEIEISNIPAEVDFDTLSGRVEFTASEFDVSADEYWYGQQLSQIEFDSEERVIRARVSVPKGFSYTSELYFSDGNNLGSFWVIGGSSVNKSKIIRSGMRIEENWQPGPIWLKLAKEDLSEFGDGEACIVLINRRSIDGVPSASGCTRTILFWSGVVWLQQVPLGTYDVIAYRQDSDGAMTGAPTIIEGFKVTNDLPEVAPPFMKRIFRHGLYDLTYANEAKKDPNNFWTVVVRSRTRTDSSEAATAGMELSKRLPAVGPSANSVRRLLTPDFDVPNAVIRFVRPYRLNLSVAGGGTVKGSVSKLLCTTKCSAHFSKRSNITLTAIPAPGKRFVGWGGHCESAGSRATCTITVGRRSSVSARFTTIRLGARTEYFPHIRLRRGLQ